MLGSVHQHYNLQHIGYAVQGTTLGLRNPMKILFVALAVILSLLVPYIILPPNKAENLTLFDSITHHPLPAH